MNGPSIMEFQQWQSNEPRKSVEKDKLIPQGKLYAENFVAQDRCHDDESRS